MNVGKGFLPVAVALAFTAGLSAQSPRRNVIIFVADGLRPGSVNSTDSPTLLSVRSKGVYFANSHATFPTFTTANAAVMATGHDPGDTGDFSNTIFAGFPIFNTGNFSNLPGTVTPFVENNQVLADLNEHFGGNYLGEDTLMALARQAGYMTASIGKVGPVAIQDVTQLNPLSAKNFVPPAQTIVIDDNTGSPTGVPLSATVTGALMLAGVSTTATPRNQPSGNNTTPGTTSANIGQQQYFADALTKAVLPMFVMQNKPFLVLFWSRDADGTQHNQGDSLNKLSPGINGATSRAAVKNADGNLKQILDYINSVPGLAGNTDIFVTADHGFATISRKEIDASGKSTSSYATTFTYKDTTGTQEVNSAFLPPGFLAIDIAHSLNLPLYDPDSVITDASGKRVYMPVDPTSAQQTATTRQRPASGNGIIGGTGAVLDTPDGKVFVAANGGSDLIYIPSHDRTLLGKVVDFLTKQDYVSGLFVDDIFGSIPGTLPLSAIGLKGTSELPVPAIAVNYKTFAMDPGNRLMTAVQIADTTLQEGQGMHGTLSRDNTFNNMAAIGPDFRSGFVDRQPVANRDIPVTLAHIMGITIPKADGRVLTEALAAGPRTRQAAASLVLQSPRTSDGIYTVLLYQRLGRHLYFDEACFATDATITAENPCVP
jgi:hypothetical protein